MARIVIPISISFVGGGMPWTLEGEVSTEWTTATISSPYALALYWEAGYVEDQEWSLEAEPSDTWTLAA